MEKFEDNERSLVVNSRVWSKKMLSAFWRKVKVCHVVSFNLRR